MGASWTNQLRGLVLDCRDSIDWSRSSSKWGLCGVFVSTLALMAICFLGRQIDPEIHRENGPLENFQAVCLAFGLVILGLAAVWAGKVAVRILALSFALLYFSLLVLEVDTREFGISWLEAIFNGTFRDIWLGLLWVGLGMAVWKWRATVLPAFRAWIVAVPGMIMIYAGLFWVLGSVVDKGKPFSSETSFFVEEMMEVNATFFMVVAAVLFEKWRRRQHGVAG